MNSTGRSFTADALKLATGSGLAQVISFASTIILSYLYAPDAFGQFGVYAALVAIPTVFVCGCYEPAILLPKATDDAMQVAWLTLVISVVVSLLSVVLALVGGRVADILNAHELESWFRFLPLHLLALGVTQSLGYWLTRATDYRNLATSRVLQSTATAGAQLAGSAGAGAGGLIGGMVFGQAVTAAFVLRASTNSGLGARRPMRVGPLVQTMKRFQRFPLFTSWGTLTSVAAVHILTPLLSQRFGPTEAGLYFFGYRLMSAGILLFSGSLGQVFYERAAKRVHDGESAAELVRELVTRTIKYAIVPFAIFALTGPQLFALAFGEEWRGAGLYMSVLVPAFFLQLTTAPASMIFFVLEKQHVAAIIQTALLAGSVVALFVSALVDATPLATVAWYAGGLSLVYIGYLYAILRNVGLTPRDLLRREPSAPPTSR